MPIAATAIAARASWRVALVVLAAAALALILPFALFAVREPPGGRAARRAAAARRASRRAKRRVSTWPQPCARAASGSSRGVLFVFYFYYLGVINHLIAFLSDSGFSDPRGGARFGGAVAVGIVGKLAIGVLADRIPIKAALLANFALVTLASLLLLFVGAAGRAARVPGACTASRSRPRTCCCR